MFGESSAVPEEFEVSVVAVFLPEQVESVAECEQQFAIGLVVTASFAVFDARSECVDALSRIGHYSLLTWDCKV